MKTTRLTLFVALTASCLAIQLIPRFPNVEFTSLFTFIMGTMQGALAGAFFGSFVMFVNGFLSPWGLAGLNLPFQMVGMAFAGVCGGIYRKFMQNENNPSRFCLETTILGAFIALIYDLITNLGVGVQFILSGMNPLLALLLAISYGSLFSLIHILSNSAVFGLLFVPLTSALSNLKVGESSWLRKEHLYS